MAKIFERLKKIFRSTSRNQAQSALRNGGYIEWFGEGGDALSVATFYRCVNVLADSVASLPMQYLTRRNGVYYEDTRSQMHRLLTVEPQPERSIYDFWHYAVRQMYIAGNAYIYPRRVKGVITDLVLCSNDTVSYYDSTGTYTICDPYNGVYCTCQESEIIHLYINTCDGRRGESILTHARRTLGIASAGDEETRNRFKNGGTVRGIVSNDKSTTGWGEYQDEELQKTAMDIEDYLNVGHRIVSLPGQVGFQQLSLSSTDMQFLESRKFTVREICRFFGVNPSYVFDDSSSNYKSAEMARLDFLSTTLDPILKRIEAEFNRKLIPAGRCCENVFRFDRLQSLGLDHTTRAAYQKATIENGLYTVNEWRRAEGRQPIEGGDTPLISANLVPLATIQDRTNIKTEGE